MTGQAAVNEPTKDKAGYAAMQRGYYDERACTLQDAQGLVHPDFALASEQAPSTQAHALLEFVQRSYATGQVPARTDDIFRQAFTLPKTLRALDFGCGVGRLMQPLAEAGFRVDGADISRRMLDLAAANPALHESQFFLSSGFDCGAAPEQSYDLIYSYLCVQHVCSRAIRNDLLSAFRRLLRPGGMVLVQMHFYPHAQAASVPLPHVPWSADHFDAAGTNSEADVWATPDELPLIYGDFAQHFNDVRMQFVDFPPHAQLFTENYGSWFGHLLVSATTGHSMGSRLYGRSGR